MMKTVQVMQLKQGWNVIVVHLCERKKMDRRTGEVAYCLRMMDLVWI